MKRGVAVAGLGVLLLAWMLRGGETAPSKAAPRPVRSFDAPSTPLFVEIPGEVRPSQAPLASPPAPEAEKPEYKEPNGPTDRAIRFLMAAQNEDGSWGRGLVMLDGQVVGSTGLTALAVLAFLECQYSHLSKDAYGGRVTGDAVRRGLDLILRRLGADGRITSNGHLYLEQALGSLALLEAYGMTGSAKFKEPAERSLAELQRLQASDGTWVTRTQTDWAAEAIHSARESDLPVEYKTLSRLQKAFESREWAGPDAAAALHRLRSRREKDPSVDRTAAVLVARPVEASPASFGSHYFQNRLMVAAQAPQGAAWKEWTKSFYPALTGLQEEDGGWPGADPSSRVLSTSLATLNLGYRYVYRPAVFGQSAYR